jgi:MFS family permease
MSLSTLNRDQKEAIGLLSAGTFLEYFDLMIYVHMAVLLNDLFFPQTDPHVAALLSAFAFCSSYVMRPIGALVFGWIGDRIGRKSTIIITALMMAFSCFIMATLPTYAQIGISASYLVTLCRILQGLSVTGEQVGAEIYLLETIKPPTQYPAVTMITTFAGLGGSAALGVASLCTSQGYNWRYVFWFGLIVGLVGVVARTRLRETVDFANFKKWASNNLKAIGRDQQHIDKILKYNFTLQIQKKTIISLFIMQLVNPICFYLTYIYCTQILKSLGLSMNDILNHNFWISLLDFISVVTIATCSYYIHPLKIAWVRAILFTIVMPIGVYLLHIATSSSQVFIAQIFFSVFAIGITPTKGVLFHHLPIFKRFTIAGVAQALARASMYIITSFGIVYLVEYLGILGLLLIFIPTIGYFYGLCHFTKLDREYNERVKAMTAHPNN